jgi:succinoglycan biosynthesis protein ExoL
VADLKILYLVPDLGDPAVPKRLAMLQAGGATVTVMGFRRGSEAVMHVAGHPAIDLGQTHNGRFVQRIAAILRETVRISRQRVLFEEAEVILARNLEMLALAVRGRSLCTVKPKLVYECLDIHRLMLNAGPVGKALRGLEGWLAKRAGALLTSSPAFVTGYFAKLSTVRLPIRLVENKVFAESEVRGQVSEVRKNLPWKIGWFGAIRCRQSLQILSELVRASEGAVEVIIRGRPALDQFEDFAASTTTVPGLTFRGPYTSADLAVIYGEVHFSWAIDRFEAGQNSSWLLPNRLYEGGLYGAVPLAESTVETGRFLTRLGVGVPLPNPLPQALAEFFQGLTPESYQTLAEAAAVIPRETWVYDEGDCQELVAYLGQARK